MQKLIRPTGITVDAVIADRNNSYDEVILPELPPGIWPAEGVSNVIAAPTPGDHFLMADSSWKPIRTDPLRKIVFRDLSLGFPIETMVPLAALALGAMPSVALANPGDDLVYLGDDLMIGGYLCGLVALSTVVAYVWLRVQSVLAKIRYHQQERVRKKLESRYRADIRTAQARTFPKFPQTLAEVETYYRALVPGISQKFLDQISWAQAHPEYFEPLLQAGVLPLDVSGFPYGHGLMTTVEVVQMYLRKPADFYGLKDVVEISTESRGPVMVTARQELLALNLSYRPEAHERLLFLRPPSEAAIERQRQRVERDARRENDQAKHQAKLATLTDVPADKMRIGDLGLVKSLSHAANPDEARTLARELKVGEPLVIRGTYRMGKTSLAWLVMEAIKEMDPNVDVMMNDAKGENFYLFYSIVNADNVNNVDSGLLRIADKVMGVTSQTPALAGEPPLAVLDRWLGERGRKLIIHFDEAIGLISKDESSVTLAHFLARLKGLKNVYSLVDLHYIERYEAQIEPILAGMPVHFVRNLNREELKKYLLRIEASGHQLSAEAEADEIFASTGGHPLLVNIMVSQILTNNPSTVSLQGDTYYSFFWLPGFSDVGRALLSRIAEGERIAANEADNALLKGALAMGWIDISDNHYRIVGNIFTEFVRRQKHAKPVSKQRRPYGRGPVGSAHITDAFTNREEASAFPRPLKRLAPYDSGEGDPKAFAGGEMEGAIHGLQIYSGAEARQTEADLILGNARVFTDETANLKPELLENDNLTEEEPIGSEEDFTESNQEFQNLSADTQSFALPSASRLGVVGINATSLARARMSLTLLR